MLIRLIKVTSVYPPKLYLAKIVKEARTAFASGARSLVYKATWEETPGNLIPVALKKPQVEGKKEAVRKAILEVRFNEYSYPEILSNPESGFCARGYCMAPIETYTHIHPLTGLYEEPDDERTTYAVSLYCKFTTLHDYILGESVADSFQDRYHPGRDCIRLVGTPSF